MLLLTVHEANIYYTYLLCMTELHRTYATLFKVDLNITKYMDYVDLFKENVALI
jgi:hypothetical protein